MRLLGYKFTRLTTCFLGCSAKVFEHTEGNGDYVLLDALGPPWKVHPCYENRPIGNSVERFPSLPSPDWEMDFESLDEFERLMKRVSQLENRRPYVREKVGITHPTVRPDKFLGKALFHASGVLHFYREDRLSYFLSKLRTTLAQQVEQIFGRRNSELGIVDPGGNLFICFADMRNVVITPGESVDVALRACEVPIRTLSPVFLCESLRVYRRPAPPKKGSLHRIS